MHVPPGKKQPVQRHCEYTRLRQNPLMPLRPVNPPCPLCHESITLTLASAHGRRYFDCPRCRLAFMDPADRPSPEAERARYDTHENDPSDPGYRSFLSRLLDPLRPLLPPGSRGLDYGAGPGPALQAMLEESGHPTRIYDPFYAPDPIVLEDRYDFVTCTETAEHFHDPEREFRRLDGLLRPGGWLAIMTEVLDDQADFGAWYYARDPTHVVFYRRTTLEWVADRHGWMVHFPHRNVGLFRKPAEGERQCQGPPSSSEAPETIRPDAGG